jgi:outer membrane receptor protein involved in Fe transport
LPGFNFSADYYRVAIKREIGSLTNQNIVDLCQLYGNSSYCNFVNLNGAYGTSNPSYVIVEPFNIAEAVTDGFDFEGSYAFDGQAIDLPGNFALRALATHVSKFISNSGILGNPISELAGSEAANSATTDFGGGVPSWKIFATETWNINPVSFTVTERGYSQSVFNPYAVVCQAPNCPAPTAQNPTYASNNLPGYFYVDLGGIYQVSDVFQTYFKVNNVGDILPKPFATLGSDPIGRMYFVGLRFTY